MPTILVYAAVFRMCLREGSVDIADPVTDPDRPIIEGLGAPTLPPSATHPRLVPAQGTGVAAAFPARHRRTPGVHSAAHRGSA